MKELHWTPESIADRESIYDYIEVRNAAAAVALDEKLSDAAARLAEHPSMGRLGRVSGTRELVVHANYVLVYDYAGRSIRILRVLHSARQWPPVLNEP